MREQYVQMQLTAMSGKIDKLAYALVNIRANYAVLSKALEIAGVLTPEKFKEAVDYLSKAGPEDIPSDPAEGVKEDTNGVVLPSSDVLN
jgi:hypothetical protein